MITGAMLLTRESRFSFEILQDEKKFLTERVHRRVAQISGAPGARA